MSLDISPKKKLTQKIKENILLDTLFPISNPIINI
jgi:hypothetical protein